MFAIVATERLYSTTQTVNDFNLLLRSDVNFFLINFKTTYSIWALRND